MSAPGSSDRLDHRPEYWRSSDTPPPVGGGHLPDFAHHEVEIARISMPGTTLWDVTSVRARLDKKGRIHYRVVDEYESEFCATPKSSDSPQSFGEFVRLLDSIAVAESSVVMTECIRPAEGQTYIRYLRTQGNDDADPLCVRVESECYPDLHGYYKEQMERWDAEEFAREEAEEALEQEHSR